MAEPTSVVSNSTRARNIGSIFGGLAQRVLTGAAKWIPAAVATTILYLVGLEKLNPFQIWKALYRIPLASLTAGLIVAVPIIGIPIALVAVGKEVPRLISKVESLVAKSRASSGRLAERINAPSMVDATQPPPPGFQPPPPGSQPPPPKPGSGPGRGPRNPSPGSPGPSTTSHPGRYNRKKPIVSVQPGTPNRGASNRPYRPGQLPGRPGSGGRGHSQPRHRR